MINVDIGLDDEWDMKGDVYKALLWGAMVGKVKAIVGNPPCRTIAKMHPETKGGFTGYKYNKELELIAKQLFLHLVSYTAMEGLEPLFVFGAPSHYKGVWEHEMIKEFEAAVMSIGVGRVQLEQGELGHPLPAPTTVLQNIDLDYLDGMRDRRPELLREDGASAPREDRWTAGLRRAIVDGIRSKGLGDGKTKGDPEENPELRRLTKEQGWKLHIQRDHVPFRKDCEQCVMALGTGRPHRRTKQKSAYVLSVDTGGPMRVKSKDAHGSGYKFFLAAAYTKPRFADLDQEKEPEPEDMADATYDFADLELDPLPPQEQEGDHLSDYEPALPGDVEEPSVKKVTGKESGAWLWDDDTDAEEQQRRDELEDESGEGNAGIPMDHLYFIKPLKGKSGKQVLQAIQEVILELRQENLPVVRIHSDRAHELRSPALREWTLNNGILLTRTEGQAPQSNGTAERAVRYLKGHARKLLRTSGLGTSHWAPAMITAAHHQREQRLRPETYQPPCPFGTRVAIKKKRYGQGGHYDLLSRWTRGVYLGPVWDVRHGSAVLEDDSGRITVTTHIRPHLKDTGSAADAPLLEVQPPTRRRLKGKTAVDDDGVALRAFSPGGVGRKSLEGELLQAIRSGIGFESVKRPQLKDRGDLQEDAGYVTVGAYQHGGIVGVTNFTKDNPEFAAIAAELMAMVFPDEVFTSITVVRDARMPLHRDVYNDKSTYNLIVPLQVSPDAAVWEELQPGDPFIGPSPEKPFKARVLPGQIHSLKSEVKIKPDRFHCAVQENNGPRVLLAGHTISSWRKLKGEHQEKLDGLGFRVPNAEEATYLRARALRTTYEQIAHYPYVVDEMEALDGFDTKDPEVEVDEDIKRCAKAAVENLYTRDIEKVLAELDGELRVVHTVHPREMEDHVEKWVPAMEDEINSLEKKLGAVKRHRGQSARDYLAQPGVTVVPGKVVCTVKPPSKEGQQYRRKARIVGCGNFQPRDPNEINYSGGAVSEAVRLGIAEAARRRWHALTGDVVSAFLRAPVPPDTRLALRPPAALIRAGLATQDEIWEVQTALYGFRTSPRWWSSHRMEKMREAKTEAGLVFKQGVADQDVWQAITSEGEIAALIIVYVDDYLVVGSAEACLDIHQWFSTTWETTQPSWATPTTAVRFLGMEIKQCLSMEGEIEGYTLDQEGYIEELLRHHGVGEQEKSLIPAQKELMTLDPTQFPISYTPAELKQAQSMTGELAWLAQRCRPDLTYVVSIMGSLATRDPARVALIGHKALPERREGMEDALQHGWSPCSYHLHRQQLRARRREEPWWSSGVLGRLSNSMEERQTDAYDYQ